MPYWKASCSYFHSDRKDLLDLYNAVSGKHYEDPELLEIFQRF